MSLKTYIRFAMPSVTNLDIWDTRWLNETTKQNPKKAGIKINAILGLNAKLIRRKYERK